MHAVGFEGTRHPRWRVRRSEVVAQKSFPGWRVIFLNNPANVAGATLRRPWKKHTVPVASSGPARQRAMIDQLAATRSKPLVRFRTGWPQFKPPKAGGPACVALTARSLETRETCMTGSCPPPGGVGRRLSGATEPDSRSALKWPAKSTSPGCIG